MRIQLTIPALSLALVSACTEIPDANDGLSDDALTRAERLEHLLSILASDSMQGRKTGTPGSTKAALFLANELARYGLDPAGDNGFFQDVPLARIQVDGPNGPRERLALPSPSLDFDDLPAENIIENELPRS